MMMVWIEILEIGRCCSHNIASAQKKHKMAAAIAVLILLLTKWSVILRKEVKRRTRELEESYDEMKAYLDTVLVELKRDATIKGKYKK
jgi:hypothetical protein